jgi:tRNA 2-thiouridine synthesizing protein B
MLHIVNKSPLGHAALDSCLRVAQGGDLLLIEDAVYAASAGTLFEPLMRDALKRFKVYALQSDLEARGVAAHLIEGIAVVDYGGFVDLVTQNKTCQSWL